VSTAVTPAALATAPAAQTTPKTANPSSALALGKTLIAATATKPATAASSKPRLPSELEARDRPQLVISLDREAPSDTSTAKKPAPGAAVVPAPSAPTATDLPPTAGRAAPTAGAASVDASPTDLPPAGSGKPFRLPQANRRGASQEPSSEKAAASTLPLAASSAFALLRSALRTYLQRPLPWLALSAMLVLPAALVQSCLLAAVARGTDPATLVLPGIATVDLSQSKAALAKRIQTSQAKGTLDAQAAAALAALTALEGTNGAETVLGPPKSSSDGFWREFLARFLAGLVLFGLTVPLVFAALSIAAVDEQGGAALPGVADVVPILLARRELLLLSLLPTALLVAVGHAVFVIPGLILAAVFLFVPHVVVFEKRRGRAALERSLELVRGDRVRVGMTFVALALVGFVIAVLTGLLLPTSGSRATVFLNSTVGALLLLLALPVPALALARIYFDARARTGATAERLSRAARS
jgi:hypothetical protein